MTLPSSRRRHRVRPHWSGPGRWLACCRLRTGSGSSRPGRRARAPRRRPARCPRLRAPAVSAAAADRLTADMALAAAAAAQPPATPTGRRARPTSGSASATALRCRTSTGELVRKWEQWYASPPRLRAAHDRARRPLPVPHRRGGRTPRHADRAGLAAVHRECLQPAGDVQRAGVGHVAVHARHRQGLRAQAEPVPRRPPRRAGLDPRRAGLPAAAAHACSATGTWRWRPTTGARATCSARSPATARPGSPSATPACRCPTKRATTCPSCRR